MIRTSLRSAGGILERGLDLFLPQQALDAPARTRSRKIVFFTLALVVWGPVFGGVYHLLRAPPWIVALLFGVTALTLPVLWFCRRGASATFMAGWLGANLILLLGPLTIFTGGSAAPAAWWVVLLPLIGIGLGGRGVAGVLALLGALLLITFFLVGRAGLLPAPVLEVDALLSLHSVGQLGLLAAILALSLTASSFESASRQALHAANLRLAREIESRKAIEARLALAHQRLLVSAHRAGMARTAAAVLHDVGNALNSVTVSASTLEAQVRALRLDGVARARARVKEPHGSPLQRIAKVVPYLEALETILEKQRGDLLTELDGLRRDAFGVNAVIQAQQQHARRPGGGESCTIVEAVEEVLEIERRALQGAGISVDLRRETLPQASFARTPLLQIMMNLFSNARDAIREAHPQGGLIQIEGWTHDDEIGVQVIDDGVGIVTALREEIFERGFTTKTDGTILGQGLGLHASLLAARALGGTLRCESEGPGRGATFTLLLPCRAKRGGARTPSRDPVGAAA